MNDAEKLRADVDGSGIFHACFLRERLDWVARSKVGLRAFQKIVVVTKTCSAGIAQRCVLLSGVFLHVVTPKRPPKRPQKHEDSTIWNAPLSWALEPECRIQMFGWSLGS